MPCPCSLSRTLAAQRRYKRRSRKTSGTRKRRSRTAMQYRRPVVRRRRKRRTTARQSVTAYGVAHGSLKPAGMMGRRHLAVSSPYPGAAGPYATGSIGRLNYTPYP